MRPNHVSTSCRPMKDDQGDILEFSEQDPLRPGGPRAEHKSSSKVRFLRACLCADNIATPNRLTMRFTATIERGKRRIARNAKYQKKIDVIIDRDGILDLIFLHEISE